MEFPSIFFFEEGKYQIYKDPTTTDAIKSFVRKYKGNLTKRIPESKYFFMVFWDELNIYITPFMPVAKLLGVDSNKILKVLIAIAVIILPLLILGCLFIGNSEDEKERIVDRNRADEDDSLERSKEDDDYYNKDEPLPTKRTNLKRSRTDYPSSKSKKNLMRPTTRKY